MHFEIKKSILIHEFNIIPTCWGRFRKQCSFETLNSLDVSASVMQQKASKKCYFLDFCTYIDPFICLSIMLVSMLLAYYSCQLCNDHRCYIKLVKSWRQFMKTDIFLLCSYLAKSSCECFCRFLVVLLAACFSFVVIGGFLFFKFR